MTKSSKAYAKNLTCGDWIVYEGATHIVRNVADYQNGWVAIALSDGIMVDSLSFRVFDLV